MRYTDHLIHNDDDNVLHELLRENAKMGANTKSSGSQMGAKSKANVD